MEFPSHRPEKSTSQVPAVRLLSVQQLETQLATSRKPLVPASLYTSPTYAYIAGMSTRVQECAIVYSVPGTRIPGDSRCIKSQRKSPWKIFNKTGLSVRGFSSILLGILLVEEYYRPCYNINSKNHLNVRHCASGEQQQNVYLGFVHLVGRMHTTTRIPSRMSA
eukprot:2111549-Rhodomonas_salina.1